MWLPHSEEFVNVAREREEAEKALTAARGGNEKIEARAVHRLVRAKLAEVGQARWDADKGFERIVEVMFEDAVQLASEHLDVCRASQDQWSEALMLLALGQAEYERNEYRNCRVQDFDDVLKKATDAQSIFQQLGEHGLEAYTWMLAADVHRRREQSPTCWKTGCNETFDALDQALLLFEDTDDDLGMARAKHMLGVAHVLKNETSEGLHLMQDARDGFVRAQSTWLEAVELLSMADVHLDRNKGREALPNAEQALDIFKEVGHGSRRMMQAVGAVVKAHVKRGDDDTALRIAMEWCEFFEGPGTPRQYSLALMTLALTYAALGQMDVATETLETARSVVQKVNDAQCEFDFLLEAAEVSSMKGGHDEAMELGQCAIAIARNLKDRKRECMAMKKVNSAQLAKLYDQSVLDESIIDDFVNMAEEQYQINTELGDHCAATMARLGVVSVRGTQCHFEEGRKLAETCLAESREYNDKGGEVCAHHFLAELNADLGQYEVAVRAARDMQKGGRELGDELMQQKALKALSKIHLRAKHFKEATRDAERALALAERRADGRSIVEFLIMISEGCAQASLPKAMAQVKTALNLSRKLRNKQLEGEALLNMGAVLMQRGRHEDPAVKRVTFDEALHYVKESLEVFHTALDLDQQAGATTIMSRIYYYMGEQVKAEDAAEASWAFAQMSCEADVEEMCLETFDIIGRRPSSKPREDVYERVMQRSDGSKSHKAKGLTPHIVAETVAEMVSMASEMEGTTCMDTPLLESGMDSLTAVSFRNGLQQRLGVKLNFSILYDCPTMRDLVQHIVQVSMAAQMDSA